MEKAKKIARSFLSPPWWIYLILIPGSVVLLVFGLSARFNKTALAYISYLVSTYTLCIVVRSIPRCVRFLDRKIKSANIVQRLGRTKYGQLLLNDNVFRGTATIYPGLIINFGYAIFRAVTAFVYHSLWFASIGVYYFFMGILRLVLVNFLHKERKMESCERKKQFEYRCCIVTGFLMLLVNIAMSSVILMVIRDDFHYTYSSYLLYLAVAHAFYAFCSSAISYIKYRKYDNTILSTSKIVSLSGALMSLFIAQDALLTTFGSNGHFGKIMGAVSGGQFVAVANLMAVATIVRSIIKLYQLEKKPAH